MGLEQGVTIQEARPAYRSIAVLLTCVLLVAVTLTWTYLGMRAVMDVGGTCAEGGPYVVAQPCPSGAWLISIAIPVLVSAAMLGSFVALRLGAPGLLVPMWAFLFGSLGWNFLEYGFGDDGPVAGWIVCGVVFELMALPALGVMLAGARFPLAGLTRVATAERGPQAAWYIAYVVLGALGLAVGTWSFHAIG
jgi:hypothetical protein